MKFLIIAGLLLMLTTFGCVSNAQSNSANTPGDTVQADGTIVKADGTMIKPDGTMIKPDGTMVKADGTMVKEDSPSEAMSNGVKYVSFTQDAYNQAKADGKTIFLEFYANWCPICKAQDPSLRSGLSKIESDNLVAFQVNYNDSETDADEQVLAKKYNITYQHTHIVVSPEENVLLRSNESWSEENVIEKVGAFS